MTPVVLKCEGASCNGGFSATEREATILGRWPRDHQRRDDVQRDARRETTQGLHYQPHVRVSGVDRHGNTRWACCVCQHERVYGRLAETWTASPYGTPYGGSSVDPVYT